jgi:hypothetical protein
MQTVDWLDSKTPGEITAVSFDFKNVVSSVDSVESVSITIKQGIDAGVNNMLLNTATLTGLVVTQLIRNGIDGNTYLITATINKAMSVIRWRVICQSRPINERLF